MFFHTKKSLWSVFFPVSGGGVRKCPECGLRVGASLRDFPCVPHWERGGWCRGGGLPSDADKRRRRRGLSVRSVVRGGRMN